MAPIRKDTCTWQGCQRRARNEQIAADGDRWANLCDDHAEFFEAEHLMRLKPAQIVGNWIKAQGGAIKAADRVWTSKSED